MSPLEAMAAESGRTTSEPIITVTPEALEHLVELRDDEADGAQLGLRLAIASDPGEDFRYDLSFEEFLKAAFEDEVRTHDGLKVIIPGADVELLTGATLDYTSTQGLVIRNPNRPAGTERRGSDQRRRAVGRDRGARRLPRSTRRWRPTAASSPTSATTVKAPHISRWAAAATAAR